MTFGPWTIVYFFEFDIWLRMVHQTEVKSYPYANIAVAIAGISHTFLKFSILIPALHYIFLR